MYIYYLHVHMTNNNEQKGTAVYKQNICTYTVYFYTVCIVYTVYVNSF